VTDQDDAAAPVAKTDIDFPVVAPRQPAIVA